MLKRFVRWLAYQTGVEQEWHDHYRQVEEESECLAQNNVALQLALTDCHQQRIQQTGKLVNVLAAVLVQEGDGGVTVSQDLLTATKDMSLQTIPDVEKQTFTLVVMETPPEEPATSPDAKACQNEGCTH